VAVSERATVAHDAAARFAPGRRYRRAQIVANGDSGDLAN
jgi:hypothetical protein